MKHRITPVAAVGLFLAMAGCVASVSPVDSTPPSPDQDAALLANPLSARQRADWLAGIAQAAQMTEPPVIPVELWGSPSETQARELECQAESGFPVDEDGYSGAPPEQAEAFWLAFYTCVSRFAVLDEYMQPMTDEQLTVIYEHQRDVVLPCLRGLGYEPNDPPTLEVFLENPDAFDPTETLGIEHMGQAEYMRLDRECLTSPPEEALWKR